MATLRDPGNPDLEHSAPGGIRLDSGDSRPRGLGGNFDGDPQALGDGLEGAFRDRHGDGPQV